MATRETKPSAATAAYDKRARSVYSFQRTVKDLIVGHLAGPGRPLGGGIVRRLDLRTLRKVPADWVTREFRDRRGDKVWVVEFRAPPPVAQTAAGRRRGRLFLLLEHQSRNDPHMALRMLEYATELLRDLRAENALGPGGRLPLMLPVVVYDGVMPWSAATRLTDRVEWPASFDEEAARLLAWQPSIALHAVDYSAHSNDDLARTNVVSLQIAFSLARSMAEARSLTRDLMKFRDPDLRAALYGWAERSLKRQGLELPPLEELERMKTENEVVTLFDKNARAIADGLREEGRLEGREEGREEGRQEGREKGRQEGREEGRQEGRREGIENERALLRRLATRRFGPATADRLTELIDGIDDAPRLARVGDCIVDCPTGDDLLAQVAGASGDP